MLKLESIVYTVLHELVAFLQQVVAYLRMKNQVRILLGANIM